MSQKGCLSLLLVLLMGLGFSALAHHPAVPNIVSEPVTYNAGGVQLKGYLVYDAANSARRPAVIVVPEWWGLNDYARRRAEMLAGLGYVAFAADYYGDGRQANDPKAAQELATPFYQDPELGMGRMQAAITYLKVNPYVDTARVAAIGYCFGGSMVLNAAKSGMPLSGVVSFHGGLATVPARQGSVRGKILVCHGGADKFVSDAEVKAFRKNLDTLHVPYQFVSYPGATHAFSNPDATANGKLFNLPIAYDKNADVSSWAEMKKFLTDIFAQ